MKGGDHRRDEKLRCGCWNIGRLRVRDVRKEVGVIFRIRECERCGQRYVSEERLVGRAEKRTIRR